MNNKRKSKPVAGIAGSLLFVVAGILMITTIADLQSRHPPIFVKIAGIAVVIFFSITCFYSFKELFKR